jgi:hypothetical protein
MVEDGEMIQGHKCNIFTEDTGFGMEKGNCKDCHHFDNVCKYCVYNRVGVEESYACAAFLEPHPYWHECLDRTKINLEMIYSDGRLPLDLNVFIKDIADFSYKRGRRSSDNYDKEEAEKEISRLLDVFIKEYEQLSDDFRRNIEHCAEFFEEKEKNG